MKSGTSDIVVETKNNYVKVNKESGYDYQVAIIDLEGNRISEFGKEVED